MSCSVRSSGWFRAVLSLALWVGFSLSAQQTPVLTPTSSGAIPEKLSPPPPSLTKPPVDLFRSLLAMTPVERREFLANRSPEAQKLILAKLQEYQSLQPEQRELRLRVTELRWYLLPLLNVATTNRTVQLDSIPATLRTLVEDRLQQWDKLSPEVQKELLDNESTVRFFFELAARTPAQRTESVTNMPAASREKLESGIRHWKVLTDEQRQEVVQHFNQFFDLTASEKEHTLRTLSEPERVQIEKTLRTFESLTPTQRAQCLRSFQKFASLSPEERQQFLKNAERWERMTPSERQSWRNLVSNLSRQPPVPFGLRPPPNPPLPSSRAPASWATNSN